MIVDKLKNAHLYYGLSQGLAAGLKFLEETDFSDIEAGKYEIDGTDLFYMVQEYTTKPVQEGKWESHQVYIDIQYVVSGVEQMGYAQIDNLEISEAYDESKDLMFFIGEGDYLKASAGDIFIFYPHDAHKPTLTLNEPQQMKKVLVKVKI